MKQNNDLEKCKLAKIFDWGVLVMFDQELSVCVKTNMVKCNFQVKGITRTKENMQEFGSRLWLVRREVMVYNLTKDEFEWGGSNWGTCSVSYFFNFIDSNY